MKKKILNLFSILMVMFFAISHVYALEVAEAGDDFTEEGTYDSLRFVAGNKVVSKATINGISFVAGNDIYLEGSVTYGIYAGNTISIIGNVEKDLIIAGNKIVIDKDATIGRDVYIAGNQIEIKTNLVRDLRAGGSTIDLSGIIVGGDAYIGAEKLIMDENTVISGTLTYYDDTKVTGLDKATIGNVVTKTVDKVNIEYGFKERVYSFIVSFIAALITMLCLLHFMPILKDKLNDLDLSFGNIAKTACIGFVILVFVPIVSLIALFTGLLTPLAVIILAIYFIMIYLSTLFVGQIVGRIIAKKLFKKEDLYLTLAIGILIIKLLKIIPVVGGYIGAVILFYGLGIIYNFLKNREK